MSLSDKNRACMKNIVEIFHNSTTLEEFHDGMRRKVALFKIFRVDAAHTQALSTVHRLSSLEEMKRQGFTHGRRLRDS